jgi:hypothetical protein
VAKSSGEHWFSKIATDTANGSGRPWAFGLAAGFVGGWLITGPVFHFSDTWQLVMNTISSIVTFLIRVGRTPGWMPTERVFLKGRRLALACR